MKAIWNNQIIAEATKEEIKTIENNSYFPPSAIKQEYFKSSTAHTTCPWKGKASYYSLEVDGHHNTDAAWYYPEPSERASEIKDYVAFWKGVKIED
jgi:uncharacterized protein (DUF427 family)